MTRNCPRCHVPMEPGKALVNGPPSKQPARGETYKLRDQAPRWVEVVKCPRCGHSELPAPTNAPDATFVINVFATDELRVNIHPTINTQENGLMWAAAASMLLKATAAELGCTLERAAQAAVDCARDGDGGRVIDVVSEH